MSWPGCDKPSGTAPSPPKPAQPYGRRGPFSAHLLPLLLLALGLLQGCLQLHNVPPEEFPRHHSPRLPPSVHGAHNHLQQGATAGEEAGIRRPPGHGLASLPRHEPQGGGNNPGYSEFKLYPYDAVSQPMRMRSRLSRRWSTVTGFRVKSLANPSKGRANCSS